MSPHDNAIAHPLVVLHADNGRAYELQTELDLRNAKDALNYKKLENRCLVDICRRQATVIKTQELMIATLEKRLRQALINIHPMQLKRRKA